MFSPFIFVLSVTQMADKSLKYLSLTLLLCKYFISRGPLHLMLWSGKRSPCLETSHRLQPTIQIIWIVNWLFHYQNLIGNVNIWRPDPVTEPRLTFQTDKKTKCFYFYDIFARI